MQVNSYLTREETDRLQNVKIGIGGAGGLGSNAAAHLVRAGIEHLVIADFDTVSEGNLNRQFFFRDQIGKFKTEALAENLWRINPDLHLELHQVRVTKENIHRLFDGCDLFLEAFDSVESKFLFVHELLPLGRPVIASSGLAGWGNTNAMQVRKAGENLYLTGDLKSGIGEELAPHSPRVGIAAAQEANVALALLLGKEI